jgi:hypothetical protein
MTACGSNGRWLIEYSIMELNTGQAASHAEKRAVTEVQFIMQSI